MAGGCKRRSILTVAVSGEALVSPHGGFFAGVPEPSNVGQGCLLDLKLDSDDFI